MLSTWVVRNLDLEIHAYSVASKFYSTDKQLVLWFLTLSEFYYLSVWDAFYFQDRLRMDIAFFYGFLHAVLAHHVHNRRVLYHVDSFFNIDFAAIIKLILDVENNFSLSQSSSKQFTVTDSEKHVSPHFLQVNVNIQLFCTLKAV